MRIIGITGGVGAGKSQILSYIEEHYSCRIIRADEAAHLLEQPGYSCYDGLISLLGETILDKDGTIHRGKMAEVIFRDKSILEKVNALIHPAVKEYIKQEIKKEQEEGKVKFFFIEAALLIEERYNEIADELWYIHADVSIREKRLAENRQYSAEKTAGIMKRQLAEEVFRKHCRVVITNNGSLADTYKQIDKIMGEYL